MASEEIAEEDKEMGNRRGMPRFVAVEIFKEDEEMRFKSIKIFFRVLNGKKEDKLTKVQEKIERFAKI